MPSPEEAYQEWLRTQPPAQPPAQPPIQPPPAQSPTTIYDVENPENIARMQEEYKNAQPPAQPPTQPPPAQPPTTIYDVENPENIARMQEEYKNAQPPAQPPPTQPPPTQPPPTQPPPTQPKDEGITLQQYEERMVQTIKPSMQPPVVIKPKEESISGEQMLQIYGQKTEEAKKIQQSLQPSNLITLIDTNPDDVKVQEWISIIKENPNDNKLALDLAGGTLTSEEKTKLFELAGVSYDKNKDYMESLVKVGRDVSTGNFQITIIKEFADKYGISTSEVMRYLDLLREGKTDPNMENFEDGELEILLARNDAGVDYYSKATMDELKVTDPEGYDILLKKGTNAYLTYRNNVNERLIAEQQELLDKFKPFVEYQGDMTGIVNLAGMTQEQITQIKGEITFNVSKLVQALEKGDISRNDIDKYFGTAKDNKGRTPYEIINNIVVTNKKLEQQRNDAQNQLKSIRVDISDYDKLSQDEINQLIDKGVSPEVLILAGANLNLVNNKIVEINKKYNDYVEAVSNLAPYGASSTDITKYINLGGMSKNEILAFVASNPLPEQTIESLAQFQREHPEDKNTILNYYGGNTNVLDKVSEYNTKIEKGLSEINSFLSGTNVEPSRSLALQRAMDSVGVLVDKLTESDYTGMFDPHSLTQNPLPKTRLKEIFNDLSDNEKAKVINIYNADYNRDNYLAEYNALLVSQQESLVEKTGILGQVLSMFTYTPITGVLSAPAKQLTIKEAKSYLDDFYKDELQAVSTYRNKDGTIDIDKLSDDLYNNSKLKDQILEQSGGYTNYEDLKKNLEGYNNGIKVTGLEWAESGAMLALDVLMLGGAGFVGTAGKLATAGITLGSAGIFLPSVIKTVKSPDVQTGEKVLAIAGEVLLVGAPLLGLKGGKAVETVSKTSKIEGVSAKASQAIKDATNAIDYSLTDVSLTGDVAKLTIDVSTAIKNIPKNIDNGIVALNNALENINKIAEKIMSGELSRDIGNSLKTATINTKVYLYNLKTLTKDYMAYKTDIFLDKLNNSLENINKFADYLMDGKLNKDIKVGFDNAVANARVAIYNLNNMVKYKSDVFLDNLNNSLENINKLAEKIMSGELSADIKNSFKTAVINTRIGIGKAKDFVAYKTEIGIDKLNDYLENVNKVAEYIMDGKLGTDIKGQVATLKINTQLALKNFGDLVAYKSDIFLDKLNDALENINIIADKVMDGVYSKQVKNLLTDARNTIVDTYRDITSNINIDEAITKLNDKLEYINILAEKIMKGIDNISIKQGAISALEKTKTATTGLVKELQLQARLKIETPIKIFKAELGIAKLSKPTLDLLLKFKEHINKLKKLAQEGKISDEELNKQLWAIMKRTEEIKSSAEWIQAKEGITRIINERINNIQDILNKYASDKTWQGVLWDLNKGRWIKYYSSTPEVIEHLMIEYKLAVANEDTVKVNEINEELKQIAKTIDDNKSQIGDIVSEIKPIEYIEADWSKGNIERFTLGALDNQAIINEMKAVVSGEKPISAANAQFLYDEPEIRQFAKDNNLKIGFIKSERHGGYDLVIAKNTPDGIKAIQEWSKALEMPYDTLELALKKQVAIEKALGRTNDDIALILKNAVDSGYLFDKKIVSGDLAKYIPEWYKAVTGKTISSIPVVEEKELSGKVTEFTTARGSKYKVIGDGTQRTMSQEVASEQGKTELVQETSTKTYYLTEEQMNKVGAGTLYEQSTYINTNGELVLRSKLPKSGKLYEINLGVVSENPKIGLTPLEKGVGWSHFGDNIISIEREITPTSNLQNQVLMLKEAGNDWIKVKSSKEYYQDRINQLKRELDSNESLIRKIEDELSIERFEPSKLSDTERIRIMEEINKDNVTLSEISGRPEYGYEISRIQKRIYDNQAKLSVSGDTLTIERLRQLRDYFDSENKRIKDAIEVLSKEKDFNDIKQTKDNQKILDDIKGEENELENAKRLRDKADDTKTDNDGLTRKDRLNKQIEKRENDIKRKKVALEEKIEEELVEPEWFRILRESEEYQKLKEEGKFALEEIKEKDKTISTVKEKELPAKTEEPTPTESKPETIEKKLDTTRISSGEVFRLPRTTGLPYWALVWENGILEWKEITPQTLIEGYIIENTPDYIKKRIEELSRSMTREQAERIAFEEANKTITDDDIKNITERINELVNVMTIEEAQKNALDEYARSGLQPMLKIKSSIELEPELKMKQEFKQEQKLKQKLDTKQAIKIIPKLPVKQKTEQITEKGKELFIPKPKFEPFDKQRIMEVYKGRIAWKQGKLRQGTKLKEQWYIVSPPYQTRDDIIRQFSRPKNAYVVDGVGSAYNTVQNLGYNPKTLVLMDFGMFDLSLTTPKFKGDKSALKFKYDYTKTKNPIDVKDIKTVTIL